MLSVSTFLLPWQNFISLELPKGAKILSAYEMRGKLQLSALVTPGCQNKTRNFFLVELPFEKYFSVDLPARAKILKVFGTCSGVFLLAFVTPLNRIEARNFCIIESGRTIDKPMESLRFIADFCSDDSPSISHLFEIK